MAIYVVIGVELGPTGEIERASLIEVEGRTRAQIGIPYEYDAAAVARLVRTGALVQAQLIAERGETVLGPTFRTVTRDNGQEGVEMEPDVHGRRVQDLVQRG